MVAGSVRAVMAINLCGTIVQWGNRARNLNGFACNRKSERRLISVSYGEGRRQMAAMESCRGGAIGVKRRARKSSYCVSGDSLAKVNLTAKLALRGRLFALGGRRSRRNAEMTYRYRSAFERLPILWNCSTAAEDLLRS